MNIQCSIHDVHGPDGDAERVQVSSTNTNGMEKDQTTIHEKNADYETRWD